MPSPFDPVRPFTRAEALAAGWTPWQLRHRDVVRLHRNVYVSRRVTRTLALRTRGALLIAPAGTVASHHTAALLWGGSVPTTSAIHLRIPPGETFRVDGVLAHRGSGTDHVRWHRGLPLTSPETTFCDLAATLDLVQWAADIDRREDLDRQTWRVVQVISSGLDEHPLRTLQRVEQARADRGAPPLSAFSEEWRRYFPGRAGARGPGHPPQLTSWSLVVSRRPIPAPQPT